MNNRNLTHKYKLRSPAIRSLLISTFLVASFVTTQGQQTAPHQASQHNLGTLDIPALIQASDRNGAVMHERLLEFTYIQKRISREIGPNNKLVERIRVYEAYPTKSDGRHRHILSLISKDNVPVPPDQLEKNRLYAARQMEKAEQGELVVPEAHDSSNPAQYVTAGIGIGSDGTGVWISISQFLYHCRFSDPRRTQLAGRDTLMLAMHTCRVSPGSPRENYLEKLSGIVWIDEADKIVVRLEAWPQTGSQDQEGIISTRPADEIIVYDQQLVPGGIWVPRRIRLNGIGKSAIFNGVDKDIIFEFNDYRIFSTESMDPDIIDPKKKPIPPDESYENQM